MCRSRGGNLRFLQFWLVRNTPQTGATWLAAGWLVGWLGWLAGLAGLAGLGCLGCLVGLLVDEDCAV